MSNDAESVLDCLRWLYPTAWFMVVPDGTKQLNVPVIVNHPVTYDPWHQVTEPEFKTEHIEIRQSNLEPSLWWGYGEKSNRLAYWVEGDDNHEAE